MTRIRRFFTIYLAALTTVWGQSSPIREYVYFGTRLVAVEARGNLGPNDLNYVAPAPSLRRMTMKFQISDPDGGANVSQLNVIVGREFGNLRSCYFHWTKWNNTFYLNNGLYGGSEAWLPLFLGTGGTGDVESENCKIYRSGTATAVSGAAFELTVDIEMRAALGGTLNIWTWGRDNDMVEIGWEHVGTYTPTNVGGPTAITLLNGPPGSSTVQFQYHVTDPDGGRNMFQLNTMVNTSFGNVGGCYFVVQTLHNQVWLNNGKAPPLENWDYFSLDSGTPTSISSDFCTITVAGTGHAPLGSDPNKLAITINVQFKPAMAGSGKQVWNWTRDMADVGFGWVNLATWTIP
ncbi:MAG: hypothetical protein ACKV2U_07875 [Bryobacteraceae bacterium]